MKSFIEYLDQIQELIKKKDYDQAWSLSNEAILDLRSRNDESWYMIYYQMANILEKEKKWEQALYQMGLLIMELKKIGGKGHENFIKDLLKRLFIESKYDEFVNLCLNSTDQNNLRNLIFSNILK